MSAEFAARVRSALHYDPITGEFRWKQRADRNNAWNAHFAGKVAGCLDANGYRVIGFGGRNYQASRLAWLIVHGEWPKGLMDHRDRNTSYDAIDNLRDATPSQNAANSCAPRRNRSGFKGVSWDKKSAGWRAQIRCDGKDYCLGHFDTPEAAHAAYVEAANEHFGEYARAA